MARYGHGALPAGLALALGIEPGRIVAAIGGGGKMPLLVGLAREWAGAGGRPLLTTTTRIFGFVPPEEFRVRRLGARGRAALERALAEPAVLGEVTLLGYPDDRGDRLLGLEPDHVSVAARALGADLTLIKADGSRGRGLKAHRETEPVIPERTDLVVAVAGLGAWGRPLDDESVHRAERFGALWGYAPGERVDDDAFVRALSEPEGYRLRVPPGSRYLVFLNQADDPERERLARRLGEALRERGVETWWGDLQAGRYAAIGGAAR